MLNGYLSNLFLHHTSCLFMLLYYSSYIICKSTCPDSVEVIRQCTFQAYKVKCTSIKAIDQKNLLFIQICHLKLLCILCP